MFFTVTSSSAVALFSAIIAKVSFDNWATIESHLIELLFIGKIPGTETYISFEALAAGIIFGLWLIVTYKFYTNCVIKIANLLKPDELKTRTLEDIAL